MENIFLLFSQLFFNSNARKLLTENHTSCRVLFYSPTDWTHKIPVKIKKLNKLYVHQKLEQKINKNYRKIAETLTKCKRMPVRIVIITLEIDQQNH